jgi:hypothetical protein
MKVTYELDCTPTEAREFLGLPDVRDLHAEVMTNLREKLLKNVDALSPQEMLQHWFSFNGSAAKQAQELFAGFLGGAAGAWPGAVKDNPKP